MTALQWLRRQRRGLLRAAVSVAVGGVLLFFVLRAIRTADLVETLSDISPGLTAMFWARSRRLIVTWLESLPLPPALHQRLHVAIEELGSGSRPMLLVAATLAARIATGLQYFALFAAIEQPISLVQVWFALSIRTLLFAVPVQGLGGLGTTQLWWTAGLTLIGWPARAALATSLAVHLVDLLVSVPQAALGWAYLQFRRPVPDDALPAEAEAQRV